MSQRIKAIADAATSLFLTQGYSKSQISHIAKAVGVSVGTIYHDFIGKKEIMHYILKCTIDPDFADRELELPISDKHFIGLEQDIVKVFEKSEVDFRKYLVSDINNYSFELLISDAFDMLSKYAVGCLFIEKNQFDFKLLAKHYKSYRKSFLLAMTNYIKAFIANETVRNLENVELTTILIVEILSWWTMDMRYTSFETSNISPDIAKKVCMDNIISAYKK
ncbi:MAG: TetR/AcrR family transcriptional regulator [Clostridiales bacterium]|nr:TetR/AcrR family transcriptional regulator [Clostridiales bacterium]